MRSAALLALVLAGCRADPPPPYRTLAIVPRTAINIGPSTDPQAVLAQHGIDAIVFDSDLLVGGGWERLFEARDCLLTHEHSKSLDIFWRTDPAFKPGYPVTNYNGPFDWIGVPPDAQSAASVEIAVTPTLPLIRALEEEGIRPSVVMGSWADLIQVPKRDGPRAEATLQAHARKGLTIYSPGGSAP
jgi:hypothetical protein